MRMCVVEDNMIKSIYPEKHWMIRYGFTQSDSINFIIYLNDNPSIASVIKRIDNTLGEIYNIADDTPGWTHIIELYKHAMYHALLRECFMMDLQDACRIYLEFNSDYKSDIYKQMEYTYKCAKQYFHQEFL